MSGQQGENTGVDEQGNAGGVLVGLDQRAMLDKLLAAANTEHAGVAPMLIVIEPDRSKAETVLSELSESERARVVLFAGSECRDEFSRFMQSRIECTLPERLMIGSAGLVSLAQEIAGDLGRLVDQQDALARRTRSQLDQRWNERGDAHWAERFAMIADGQRARVLVVTTRYSTYMHHSARDLVEAYEMLGHDAELLLEPDEHSGMTAALCLRKIEEYDPDLIVVVNYPRSIHQELFPQGWAHVCWVQDAMGHLFQSSSYTPTRFDFLAGHVYENAQAFAGYSEDAVLAFPVPVAETKFHNDAVSLSDAERFACDIAYVSHQSGSVDDFHALFAAQFKGEKRAMIDRCGEAVRRSLSRWFDEPQYDSLIDARDELLADLNQTGNASVSDMIWHQYMHPLGERLLRHEMLEWASQIAREHDLTLSIFGNGWEHHPTLSEHARGVIEHGEALRACYQSAGVHLHASMLGCGHQRVYECALSGGLMLCRRSWDEVYYQDWIQENGFICKGLPADVTILGWNQLGYSIENHPELQEMMAYRARVKRPPYGWNHEMFGHVYDDFGTDNVRIRADIPVSVFAHLDHFTGFKHWDAPTPPEQLRSVEILGDPIELTFSTREDLEERILRAVRDRDWREEQSSGVRNRVRQQVTMKRFAQRLLTLVGDRMQATASHSIQKAGV